MSESAPPSGWTGGDPDDFAALTLVRVSLVMRRVFIAALAPHGLAPPHFSVLLHLVEHPGRSQAHLAREVLATPQSVGEMLRTMEELGLVERTQPSSRGRPSAVYASESGRALLDRVTPDVLSAFSPSAMGLTRSDCDRMNADLHTILAALAS